MQQISANRVFVLILFVCVVAVASANSQLCGGWDVSVTLFDKNRKHLENATISFVDVKDGDDAKNKLFTASVEQNNKYIARFIEGQNVADGNRRGVDYQILIVAEGYKPTRERIAVKYCQETSAEFEIERRD